MKKLLLILLAFSLSISLVACASSGTQSQVTDDSTSSGTATSTVTESSPDNASETVAEDANENQAETNEVVFSEITVVDNDECTIKITGVDPDNIWGYTLKAYLENKNSGATYMFSVRDAAINGISCDPFFSSEVAPGKKSNEEISFTTTTLEDNGITDFTDITLTFLVYDSDDWSADSVVEETVHVYPYGEEKATSYERPSIETDTILVDNDDISVIVTGYDEDGIWGYTANLFFVNKTDSDITFSVDDSSVNGYMIDPFYATTVPAHQCSFDSMSWSESELEENNIEKVEEIEFTLRAYDSDNWMADDILEDVFTLNP